MAVSITQFTFVLAVSCAVALSPALGKSFKTESNIPSDLCKANVVFLGEDASHGGGQVIMKKAEVARSLIDQCGFNQVAFESQVYDFLAMQDRKITLADLQNAVGGIWSTAAETDDFFRYLVQKSNTGKVKLVGIDGQLGSAMSSYTKQAFAEDLTHKLPDDRAKECSTLINRLTNWRFDKSNPYDEQYTKALKSCLEDAVASFAGSKESKSMRLAENFVRFLEFSRNNYFNDRDRLMADNLKIESRSSEVLSPKTIVWTANSHASYAMNEKRQPLASYFTGESGVISIGITAVKGQFAVKKPEGIKEQELAVSSPNSLELKALAANKINTFVGHSFLSDLGKVPSKLMSYQREVTRDWTRYFHYVIVLPKEQSPHYIRQAKPQK